MDNQNTNNESSSPVEPQRVSQSSETKGDQNTIFGILAYLGPLVIVPFLMKKDDPFVKFHTKQGAVVFAIEIIAWILGSMFWGGWMLTNLINLATVVLSIMGIVNVIQHKEKELPVVGQFSKHFNF